MKPTKIKNVIYFKTATPKNEYQYAYDINSGIFYDTKQNKPIDKLCGLNSLSFCQTEDEFDSDVKIINQFVSLCVYNTLPQIKYFKDEFIDIMKVTEKMANMGYNFDNFRLGQMLSHNPAYIIYENFNSYKKHLPKEKGYYITEDFINQIKMEKRLNGINVPPHIKSNSTFVSYMLHDFDEQYVPLIVNYCIKGGLLQYNKRHSFNTWSLCEDIIKLSKDTGIMPKGINIFKEYEELQQYYDLQKDKLLNQKLLNHYDERLKFEDENFTVVVPTSIEEYTNEAEQQCNCVKRLYMEKVANGTTFVVFIRDKTNIDKSLITCEVLPNGNIEQFLLSHNRSLDNTQTELKEFYRKYQDYLYTVY